MVQKTYVKSFKHQHKTFHDERYLISSLVASLATGQRFSEGIRIKYHNVPQATIQNSFNGMIDTCRRCQNASGHPFPHE